MNWRHFAVAGGLVAAILTSSSALPAAAGSADLKFHSPGKFNAAAATASSFPCQAPFGSVQIPGLAWASGLTSTGHDGATFDVHSNYRSGRNPSACAGDWVSADRTNQWGLQYQCTELAVRVADAEWATGNWAAWTSAGWNGAADSMSAPGQRLGLTWTGNGTGSLPVPGDLMIWKSSGGGDPGHVAVVSAVGNATVTFVGENQGNGMVTLPESGTTVENNGWKRGSWILGWLSHPAEPAIVIRSGSVLLAKNGVTGSWVTEAGGLTSATKILALGDMIGYIQDNSSGVPVLWAKEGLKGTWYEEYGPVNAAVFTG